MEGRIKAVFGNMVVAEVEGRVVKNAVGHCLRSDGAKLLCEAIRVRGQAVDLQIFEETRGLRVGDAVVFAEEMLSAHLGTGLLGQIYDGLQNPLPQLAEQAGFFLKPGTYVGYHRHKGNEEIIYVVSGKAENFQGGNRQVLEAGDAILTKSGETHAVRNVGAGDLRVLGFVAPPGDDIGAVENLPLPEAISDWDQ